MDFKKNNLYVIKETGPERLRNNTFRFEFIVEEDLFQLIDEGNMAALNAVTTDYPARLAKVGPRGYSEGFCYGKIDVFGYIVLMNDLEERDDS